MASEPNEVEGINLARTKAAMQVYDTAAAAWSAYQGIDAAEELRLLDVAIEAGAKVGEAFAKDTADRNDPEVARRVRPGPWLRGLLERHGR